MEILSYTEVMDAFAYAIVEAMEDHPEWVKDYEAETGRSAYEKDA